ncbi:MAG: NAD(P)/FAD-dependent oxidoreductase [candidate division Zixibacteria bacterium]|nr:NAD(P)/FAD-dependent oxidoreductase [candidate division Zixibacteria bacterium]
MRIAIIGGGPAGFFAAISAVTNDPSAKIVIFEATSHPLDKVRISGGGRCNVTNHCFDPAELVTYYPRGGKQLRGAFNRFQPRDTVAWFQSQGVALKVEDEGRMFPTTDTSATIVDCLHSAAIKADVQIRLNTGIKSITTVAHDENQPTFEIQLPDGVAARFHRVLIATGSNARGYRLAEELGHTIVPCVPSLFTFKVTDPRLKGLAGVAFENVKLTIKGAAKRKLTQTGPMLVTHWGLSGPAVLKLSAWGARILHDNDYQAEVTVNFLPEYTTETLYRKLPAIKEQHGKKRIHTGEVLPIPKRYWTRIVQHIGIAKDTTWATITKPKMTALVEELTAARFAISGKGAFKEEFVTCGGINLTEVDFDTMQSRKCPGLYFAGEILDIDGLTGGFNFQNAWTTGWIAGASMVR